MKLLIFTLFFMLSVSMPLFAEEEKPEVDKGPQDPIGAVLLAPFQVIGAIFGGGNYEYDYDRDPYYNYYRYYDYDPWYGRYDPYDYGYGFGYRKSYRHYRNHYRGRHSYRYYRDPC